MFGGSRRQDYFAYLRKLMKDEQFMFIKAATDLQSGGPENYNPNEWFPHTIQLELNYWQKRLASGQLQKRLVTGFLTLANFNKPAGHYQGPKFSRGYEYDLRITYIPVDWITILNFFALGGTTYVLFYVVVDIVLVFVIIIGWGCFRLAVRSANPPALHFYQWLKGFELNPPRGFLMTAIPIVGVANL